MHFYKFICIGGMNLLYIMLYKKLKNFEFIRYFSVGVVVTLVDWGSFYWLALLIGLHYQLSLAISFSLGGITSYTCNKIFTFKSKSRKIIGQFSIFILLSLFSLLLSSGIMFVLVDLVLIHKMFSRILTTFTLVFINYLLHKYITFNKKFFT